MSRVLAIASNFMKAAVRTKLCFWLAAILVTGVVGLGLTVEGDGTLNGQMRVILYYTTGMIFLVLGAATVWSSCGEIAAEIQNRHIQLLAVKPIHRFEIWLGKWLGLLFLNACLLVVGGMAVVAVVKWQLHFSAAGAHEKSLVKEEVLTGRRQLLPIPEISESEIRDRVSKIIGAQQISSRVSKLDIYRAVEKIMLKEKAVVPPGHFKRWSIATPNNIPSGNQTICLRYGLLPTSPDRTPMKGTWTFGEPGTPGYFTKTVVSHPEGVHQFEVPATCLIPGEPLTVRFDNPKEEGAQTALFEPDKNVEILIRDASFTSNLVRSLFILFCKLAVLAAAGLAAGTLLSFPVASFSIISLLVAGAVAQYFVSTTSFFPLQHGEMPDPTAYQAMVRTVLEKTDAVIGMGARLSPLDMLSDGMLITWSMIAEAVLFLLLVYPAFFFLLGSYFLYRKELALPE